MTGETVRSGRLRDDEARLVLDAGSDLRCAADCGSYKGGIEAAGHYHRPLFAPTSWPVGWELLELNPAQVREQRRVHRRWVKTRPTPRWPRSSRKARSPRLTSVPDWGTVRTGNYAAAVGNPNRWPGPRQLYRASGLCPMQYESAGNRRDGAVSREGSVELRRALIDLGLGRVAQRPASEDLRRRTASS